MADTVSYGEGTAQTTHLSMYWDAAKAVVVCITKRSLVQIQPPQQTWLGVTHSNNTNNYYSFWVVVLC